jgi:hypothetical protein
MFSGSANLAFDTVFLKIQYFRVYVNIFCACIYYLGFCKYQVGPGIRFFEVFYCAESLHLYW